MALISYVKREEATGLIAEVYDMIEKRIEVIPNVVQFYTASPELFEKIMNLVGYYIDHPTLDRATVAYIRMLISNKEEATYCISLQSGILRSLEIPEEDLVTAMQDYNLVNLPARNQAMVCFVMDQMYSKLGNAKHRIEQLRQLGWTEKDIFEASVIGAIQKGMVNVVKSFEVELDF